METVRARITRLLAIGAPKADVASLADALFRVFGSSDPLFETEAEDLRRIPGMTDAAARMLHLVPHVARYCLREQAQAQTCLSSFEKAGEYLASLYLGLHNECFYLLCLDAKGRRLACPLVQIGTVDEAPFYLRRILELTLRSGASAVVLSHNHPGRSTRPSISDIECTIAAIEGLLPIDVLVLDHIIVAGGKPVSIRASGAIAEVLFTRQSPQNPLIQGWLPETDEEDLVDESADSSGGLLNPSLSTDAVPTQSAAAHRRKTHAGLPG